jgi:hypothetical protein
LEGRPHNEAPLAIEKQRSIWLSHGQGVQELARESFDPAMGTTELKRFNTPVDRIKAGALAGATWPMGQWNTDGINAEYHGEVLGVQDARTPAGLFEKCLVVRHSAPLSGVVEVGGGRVEIRDGMLSITEWFAPGTGRVLVKRELDQSMVLPDGQTIEFRERTEYALRNTETDAPQPSNTQADGGTTASPAAAPAAE